MPMQIECSDISYHYPQTGALVLDQLSCRVTGPGFHALFGQSGLGKTTLARMIAGELTGYAGRLRRTGTSFRCWRSCSASPPS